jgi:hypothetical protein
MNQRKAFRRIFGRDPVSKSDWSTAEVLDPNSYNPMYQGVNAEVRVVKIRPLEGQGVVRSSQWIEQDTVMSWPPGTGDIGNNRGVQRKRDNSYRQKPLGRAGVVGRHGIICDRLPDCRRRARVRGDALPPSPPSEPPSTRCSATVVTSSPCPASGAASSQPTGRRVDQIENAKIWMRRNRAAAPVLVSAHRAVR